MSDTFLALDSVSRNICVHAICGILVLGSSAKTNWNF